MADRSIVDQAKENAARTLVRVERLEEDLLQLRAEVAEGITRIEARIRQLRDG